MALLNLRFSNYSRTTCPAFPRQLPKVKHLLRLLSQTISKSFGNISNLLEMLSALGLLRRLFNRLLDLVENLMIILKL